MSLSSIFARVVCVSSRSLAAERAAGIATCKYRRGDGVQPQWRIPNPMGAGTGPGSGASAGRAQRSFQTRYCFLVFQTRYRLQDRHIHSASPIAHSAAATNAVKMSKVPVCCDRKGIGRMMSIRGLRASPLSRGRARRAFTISHAIIPCRCTSVSTFDRPPLASFSIHPRHPLGVAVVDRRALPPDLLVDLLQCTCL